MATPPYTLGWVYNLRSAPATSDAQGIIALAVIFPLVAVLSVALKIGLRLKTIGLVGWDDISIAVSSLINVGYSATAVYQTKWGLGLKAKDFPIENAVPFSRVQYAGGPLYCLAVLGFKLTLLISYLRVAGFNRTYAMIVWVVIGLVVVSQLIFTILLSVGCQPIARQWDPSIPGKCLDALPIYFALGGTSLSWDLLIIALPFPILRRLQLDWQRKVALGAVFGLGFFVTIVQAIRMRSIAKLSTYTESKTAIQWSVVELNLGVFVACVPTFGPLLKRFGQKVSRGSRSKPGQSSRQRKYNESHSRTPGLSRSTDHRDRTWKGPSAAEDEIELWASSNRLNGGETSVWHDPETRTRRQQKMDSLSGDDDTDNQSASKSVEGHEIRVQREITVQLENADTRTQ